MSKTVIVIGGGIGGLSTACLLAKSGYEVTLLEKNDQLGGRANVFETNGFRFDMGPSWYLMPDVFEHFFKLMGANVADYLDLAQLDPSYRIRFRGTTETIDMHSNLAEDIPTFERLEPGSGKQLEAYLEQSKYQYDVAIRNFMYKNYDTVFDFMNRQTALEGRRLHVFEKMHNYVQRYFKNDLVQKIMEYQLVFLGSSPYNTPALYNIMSHIDFNMGVFYPKGGIYAIIEALVKLGTKHGVNFRTNAAVSQILTTGKQATGVVLASGEELYADMIVSNADIHHTEMELLPAAAQQHTEKYWQKRTLAPSAFIMYLGLKDTVPTMVHHNLAFAEDWKAGFAEIFDNPKWPTDPSYYVCAPSKTDPTVAPDGKENLFVLVPIAPNLSMTEADTAQYREKVLDLLEKDFAITNIRERIEYERVYSSNDFAADYNAFGGSALGLAHTLRQTAIFRPNNVSKKLSNLYYVGAGTNPGIGMPICMISAELVYKRITGDKSSGPLDELHGADQA